ncbi:hypothetical protein FACS189499_10460 [Clostridia bacterium]|nr:hypothetical protein FACS189499_10460 [Clostridia bacterium]
MFAGDCPAPDDEYDTESRRIATKINADNSLNDIAYTISEVFTNSFGKPVSYESCTDVANKIKNAISN